MLGALLTAVAVAGLTGIGMRAFESWLAPLDRLARIGLGGLLGLGALGLLTFFIGLIPGGFRLPFAMFGVIFGVGLVAWRAILPSLRAERPESPDPLARIFGLVLAIPLLVSLVGVLGPSDSFDWDSLAYHLAVPKIWLQAGQITYLPSIHHSNFPFAVDNLFVWGLGWGGESGAKAFMLAYTILGCMTLYGLVRQRVSGPAAGLTALAFATVPVVIWESGTAYIDHAHGLWVGLGILFAAMVWEDPTRRHAVWLSAICLGFACASKYTGLQAVVAVGIAFLVFGAVRKRLGPSLKDATVIGLVALAMCGPWLVRNVINTGNPVYPFFYSIFNGRNWDDFRAKIYAEEQATFGVGITDGKRDWSKFPHAVLGLAYQPGRYVNPGQTQGGGFPIGALGLIPLAALVAWLFSGRAGPFEGFTLGTVGVMFVMWFALSQQSRYGMNMATPLIMLAGLAIAKLKVGPLLMGLVPLQALVSLYWGWVILAEPKLPVVLGSVTRENYLQRVPFYPHAVELNRIAQGGKVALYDEVFGYFLDVPYFWANPGHSTQIPYENLSTGPELAAELRRQGFTHVYVSHVFRPRDQRDRWFAAAGLGSSQPYTAEETAQFTADLRTRWIPLLAEAIAQGEMRPLSSSRSGMILAL